MKVYVKPGREYRFSGRNYGAGQEVDIPDKFVRVLTHAKGPLEQRPSRNPTDIPTEAPGNAELTTLRQEYREVIGTRPFHGWDAPTIREKIGTYRTTHMTAQGQPGPTGADGQ